MITREKLSTYVQKRSEDPAREYVAGLIETWLEQGKSLEDIRALLTERAWRARSEKDVPTTEACERACRYILGPGPFHSIADIKQAAPHFFDPASMRGLHCKVYDTVYAGRYFTCSVQYVDPRTRKRDARLYSVRVCTDDGDVSEVHDYGDFRSLQYAREGAEKLEKELEE